MARRVADLLERDVTYGRTYISRTQMDYGGFYHILYKSDEYFIFCLNPRYEKKIHCLDLSLIDIEPFNAFFRRIKIQEQRKVEELKRQERGYVKQNIKIANAFYEDFVKKDERLMKDHPYKTLFYFKVHNIRFMKYDV